MILYVQIIGMFLHYELYDFQQLTVWAVWIPILMLPYIFSKKKWIFKIILTLIFIENLLNLVHWLIIKGPLSVSSLFVVANTNLLESSDFLKLKLEFHFLLLLPYIGLFVFALLKTPKVQYSRKSFIFLIIMLLFSAIYITDNIIHARFVRKALPTTTKTIIEFVQEMKAHKMLKSREVRKVEASIKNTENERQICVLVLGESVNRNHLALYGYNRNTTPKLSTRNDLFIYSDVVNSHSNTLISIFALYTEATLENQKPIDESISLLDIFYSAGFKTFWLSNQSPIGIWDNSIFNLAQTAEYIKFVNISSGSSIEAISKISYDELLLPELSKVLTDSSQNLFITIHLMGSHSAYSKRYPSKFECFKNATTKKQKIIDHYDNSLIYTDFILDSMINILKNISSNTNIVSSLIYCADHGENLFDYNNTVGHDWSGFLPDCNVEIPFIIWLSDNYKAKYPDKTANILKNKDLPFRNDDLFHVILDLKNIETPYFEQEKSVINENYKIPENRILGDGRAYYKK
jgi:heptose-I-phosphate ethanolaminephosphotransferase